MLWKGSTLVRFSFKKFIDVGVGIIDTDYRGEVGVVLFNFGEEDFVVNMGDRIAQLIFEKIETPIVKETGDLKGTDRGTSGYGSTGVEAVKNQVMMRGNQRAETIQK